jgi:hypothetical protein
MEVVAQELLISSIKETIISTVSILLVIKHNNYFNSNSFYNNNLGMMTKMNTPMFKATEQ